MSNTWQKLTSSVLNTVISHSPPSQGKISSRSKNKNNKLSVNLILESMNFMSPDVGLDIEQMEWMKKAKKQNI